MPTYEKELLRPGRFYPRGGPVDFTEDFLRELCRESNALIASGRSIPIPLEHQDDAVPMSYADRIARRTLNNTGWVNKFYMKGPSLWCALDIDRDDVSKNIHNIKFVSPELTNRFAADGRVWKNVITHVALTLQPVWKDQSPFDATVAWPEKEPVFAGQRLSLAGKMRLSLAESEKEVPPEILSQLSGHPAPVGGIWFLGRFYPKGRYIPRQSIDEAIRSGKHAPVRDLLRKLNVRAQKRSARQYASFDRPSYTPSDAEPEIHDVPVDHLVLGDPRLGSLSTDPDDPILVWEDPQDGRTHVVAGQYRVEKLARKKSDPDSQVTVPVFRIEGETPQEARGVATLMRIMEGKAVLPEVASFMRDFSYQADHLVDEIKSSGLDVDEDQLAKFAGQGQLLSILPEEDWKKYQSGELDEDTALRLAEHADAFGEEEDEGSSEEVHAPEAKEEASPPSGSGEAAPDGPVGEGSGPGPEEGDAEEGDGTSGLAEALADLTPAEAPLEEPAAPDKPAIPSFQEWLDGKKAQAEAEDKDWVEPKGTSLYQMKLKYMKEFRDKDPDWSAGVGYTHVPQDLVDLVELYDSDPEGLEKKLTAPPSPALTMRLKSLGAENLLPWMDRMNHPVADMKVPDGVALLELAKHASPFLFSDDDPDEESLEDMLDEQMGRPPDRETRKAVAAANVRLKRLPPEILEQWKKDFEETNLPSQTEAVELPEDPGASDTRHRVNMQRLARRKWGTIADNIDDEVYRYLVGAIKEPRKRGEDAPALSIHEIAKDLGWMEDPLVETEKGDKPSGSIDPEGKNITPEIVGAALQRLVNKGKVQVTMDPESRRSYRRSDRREWPTKSITDPEAKPKIVTESEPEFIPLSLLLNRQRKFRFSISGGNMPEEQVPAAAPAPESVPEDKGGVDADDAGSSKKDDLGQVIELLEYFNVHLPEDRITNPEELVHYLGIALHALREADEGGGGVAEADQLAPEKPNSPGGIAMSLQRDIDALKAQNAQLQSQLKKQSAQNGHILDQATSTKLSLVSAKVAGMVKQGRVTKADQDRWNGVLTKHRMSLIGDSQPQDLRDVLAEIRYAENIPAGTYFDGDKIEGSDDPNVRLSLGQDLEVVPNQTPFKAPTGEVSEERSQEVLKEFWANTGLVSAN